MEQFLATCALSNNVALSETQIEKLSKYAEMIHNDNQLYNLTGLKTVQDIIEVLIIKSLCPVRGLSVPRGTRFVDVGTGSGIPGIVLAIMFPEIKGVLVDSNYKKTDFIKKVCSTLDIKNIEVRGGRIEDFGKDKTLRASFDWGFTRAFGPLYYSIEFVVPLLKKEGLLYVYSNIDSGNLSEDMICHVENTGAAVLPRAKHARFGLLEEGVLIQKIRTTPGMYPRRFPIVKRASSLVQEERV